MNTEFKLYVKQSDTLYVPITIKENNQAITSDDYTITAYVLDKVIECKNITTQTKVLQIKPEENDFIDGTYTLYLVIERKTGERKTATGKLIVTKGKINGQ